MYVSRKLWLLWGICLAMILVAFVIRLSKTFPPIDKPTFFVTPSPEAETDGLVPSRTFYETQQELSRQSKTSKTPVSTPSGPVVSARAYLVGDVSTGKIYLERNSSLILPVASMSKLLTAIEAMDKLKPGQRITISEAPSSTPDSSNFKAGETFTVEELLYPLLLNSSNIAAEALASTSNNRAKFLELMSSYAWEIGMPSTYFADPSGINPRNVSSAKDFFALARYLYKSRPAILAITKTAQVSTATTTDHGAHVFTNIHPFVADPDFLGGKTGHTTEAKDTMLTILNMEGHPIAIVVLSSNNRRKDTLLLEEEAKKILVKNNRQ